MKKKLETLINEEGIQHAKRPGAEKIAPLRNKVPDPKKREKAYQLFCERPIRISKDQFKQILEEIS